MSPEFYAIAAALVGIMGSARLVRLIVNDSYPPVVWLRIKWDDKTHKSLWNKLMHCPWCLSPYTTAVVLAWYLLSDGWARDAWWIFNGWLAASYVASWVVFHDEDGSE